MDTNKTYVIGHKNPDTDSVCSAIALAEFKRVMGFENVEAARAGDLNPQTEFILEYNKVTPPQYLSDVYLKARDIMVKDIISVTPDTPLLHAIDLMNEKEIRILPVLDKDQKPTGILSMTDLTKKFVDGFTKEHSRHVTTTYANIIKILQGEEVVNTMDSEESDLAIFVGAMTCDAFKEIIEKSMAEMTAVIVGDREDIQEEAIKRKVKLIIVSGGFKTSEDIVNKAKEAGVSIIVSPLDTATTAHLVKLSTPSHLLINKTFDKAHGDEKVDTVKNRFKNAKLRNILVLDHDGKIEGIITNTCFLTPHNINLILVDHNELSQAVDGAEEANIIEVVDHHRLGNFHTAQAIAFYCDPVGSTCTLVSELYKRYNVKLKKEIAGLLLGGVLSDTVLLKSPTTTKRDEEIVMWLQEQSGLKYEDYGKEIFNATSSIRKRGHVAVVSGDYKTFTVDDKMFGIGQVETIGFDEFYEEKDALHEVLTNLKNEKKLHMSALIVTDIVKGTSLLLTDTKEEIHENMNYPKLEENLYELKDILSRKKQVVPHVLNVFSNTYQS